jgi:hypothetical protein
MGKKGREKRNLIREGSEAIKQKIYDKRTQAEAMAVVQF